MVVIMLEKSTYSQRGAISRLAIEIKPGVFVCSINTRVREKLWQKICDLWQLKALMIYSTNTEQKFKILINKLPNIQLEDFDGLQLLSKPDSKIK